MRFPQTVTALFLAEPEPPVARRRVAAALPGRPSAVNRPPARVPAPPAEEASEARLRVAPGQHEIRRLLREWLMELKVMGRSPKTIDWYRQKVDYYLDHEGGPEYLEDLTSSELKRLLGSLQDRGLTPNTVHGYFEVLRASATGLCVRATRSTWP